MILLRRLYVYPMALVSLGLLIEGVPALMYRVLQAGLALIAGPYSTLGPFRLTEELRNAALWTLGGLVLWVIHWGSANRIAARPDEDGAAERQSGIRRLFLFTALFLGTITLVSVGAAALEGFLGIRSRQLVVANVLAGEFLAPLCGSLVWAALCAYHLYVLHRDRYPSFRVAHVPTQAAAPESVGVPERPPSVAEQTDDVTSAPSLAAETESTPAAERFDDDAALPPSPVTARRRSTITCIFASLVLFPVALPGTIVVGGWAISRVLTAVVAPPLFVDSWPVVGAESLALAVPLVALLAVWFGTARLLDGETHIGRAHGEADTWWWCYVYVVALVALIFGAGGTALGIGYLVAAFRLPSMGAPADPRAVSHLLQTGLTTLAFGVASISIWALHWRMACPGRVIPISSRTVRRGFFLVVVAFAALTLTNNLQAVLQCCPPPASEIESFSLYTRAAFSMPTWTIVLLAHLWIFVREAHPDDWDQRLLRRLAGS